MLYSRSNFDCRIRGTWEFIVKVVCLQEQLQRALSLVSRAVASKTALPVLGNVLLSAEDDRLQLSATNLEIGISTTISASVDEPGRLTVDARLLQEFVSTLPNETVELSTEGDRTLLAVKCGRDNASINGIGADEFPSTPAVSEGGFTVDVDPQVLREMIGQVEFAAATDDSRPVLAGVLLRFEDETITLAAADGFRLAVRHGQLSASVGERVSLIAPARAIRELGRILGESSEPVRLAVTPNQSQLIVRVGPAGEPGGTEFYSRLIDGTFPDYRQIIPKEFGTKVELGRDALLNAVRRASYFARDANDAIKFEITSQSGDAEPGVVEVSARAAERGDSHSFVDATIDGPEMQIAFNSRYLTDVLAVVRNGRIALGLNGPNQAGVIRMVGTEDY
ncbi:MAG TPA: DNA polymerase III subunit beta, partial [Thermomicrobiales bacterium]|nr:DNA polymerase III subunit beta [Thermomicrobiales bacterium]